MRDEKETQGSRETKRDERETETAYCSSSHCGAESRHCCRSNVGKHTPPHRSVHDRIAEEDVVTGEGASAAA